MEKPRVLLIDDDLQNLSLLKEVLSPRYEVETASDARKGLASALARPPAIAVLDIDMPDMSGYEVCEAIRAAHPGQRVAILFLSSNSSSGSMQQALHMGANDYLVKPFRMQELVSRIELRLGQVQSDLPLRCGNMTVDPATLSVTLQGARTRRLRVTHQIFRVLETLIKNEGRVLSREQLLKEAWGGDGEGASDRSVDLNIFRLRKSLRGWDHRIETIYGKGYVVTRKK